MKLIFKKRFGAFNIYSNGRIYCDVDKALHDRKERKKNKPEKKPITQESLELRKQEIKSDIQRNNEKTKQNIEEIKNCFRRFKK